MSETSLISLKDIQDAPLAAKKKWLEGRIQEQKTSLFALKQQLEKYENDIVNIREGKIKQTEYAVLMKIEDLKNFVADLATLNSQPNMEPRNIDLT